MKLNINFLQTGGVPLTNDLMQDIMSAIQLYDVLGSLAGHLTIISGCEITGNNVSPGVVAINGEVFYFEGGNIVPSVYVHSEQILKTFEDQTDKVLILKQTVKFGSGAANYNWSDFVRLQTLKEIQSKVNNSVSQQEFAVVKADIELLKLKTAPIINGGIAWAWFKPAADIPAGWKECTDIRGRVIVGLDPNDSDFSLLKGTIGAKTHKLTEAEMPRHRHYGQSMVYAESWKGNGFKPDEWNNDDGWTDYTGGDQPHNNIQPSVIAYFIEPNLP